MKKFLLFLCSILLALTFFVGESSFVFADARDFLLVEDQGGVSANADTNVDLQENFLVKIQGFLIASYAIIAVGSLLFVGFKLFSARGDEGEFKKAWVAMVYVLIGLALAPFAYALVRIVSGFSFS